MSTHRFAIALTCLLIQSAALPALQVTGYSSATNDRFQSGFPGAPVANADPAFVGAGYDWSGVGWAAGDGTKGFGFLSPQHYLVASHYGGAATLDLSPVSGPLVSGTQATVRNTGIVTFTNNATSTVMDVSLGTLAAPLPATAAPRYGILDLNNISSADTPTNYTNLPIFLYGRGPDGSYSPRIGATTIAGTYTSVNGGNASVFITTRTDVQMEGGDSGSPAFAAWTNPNGAKELALLGNNFAINDTYNFVDFIGTAAMINRLNEFMTPDGFALKLVGNPAATWDGSSGTQLSNRLNWTPSTVPTDKFSLFDASLVATRSLTVNASTNLRGAYFKATASAVDGFSFNGTFSLTLGRGGLTNYDNSRQVISAPLILGDHQFWDVGPGGITVSTVSTNAKLLEISGTGTAIISGQISGNGSLALSGSELDLNGISTYSGKTWAHQGKLLVNGSIATSSGVVLDGGSSLYGYGTASAISGAGSVNPGSSPGILTAPSVNPAAGLDFNLEFARTGSPDYSNAAASGNDVLRLTDAVPFSQSLSPDNVVNVFLNVAAVQLGDTFRGGFFTDNNVAFFANIGSAAFVYYLASPSGSTIYNSVNYDAYAGTFVFALATVQETAAFSGGTQTGQVMEVRAVPEPSAGAFLLVACAGYWLRRTLGRKLTAKSRPCRAVGAGGRPVGGRR